MENENNGEKKKKKFNLFDWYYRQGKANDKKDINALKEPSIRNFFKLLWSKFGKLMSSNIIFVFVNFPLVFLLLALSGWFDKVSIVPTSVTWNSFLSILTSSFSNANIPETSSYATSALIGIHGLHSEMTVTSVLTYVFYGLALLTVFTWGFAKVGTTYLYRNMMSGDPVFPFSDFFYIIKRNIKQSLLFGAIDFILIAILITDIVYLFNTIGNPISLFMLLLTLAMCIFYSFMRPYVYIMIFTFDLKFFQIIKNAAAFTILGIKRNIVGFLASVVIIILNVGLIFIPFVTPIGMILPFVITIAILDFIGVYCAYPNIIKYMMSEEDARMIVEKIPIEDEEIIEENEEMIEESSSSIEEADSSSQS